MPFVPFRRDHLRFTSGIIFGSRSFAVHGPGRTSVKSCLFNKKICHHIGFARATDLSDIFKNERNAPNVQRYRHLKLPSSGPSPKCHKTSKKLLRCQSERKK